MVNEHHVLAVFIGIAKAYGTVCTDALLFKLLKLDINGKMFDLIRGFLTNRSFQVRFGSTHIHGQIPSKRNSPREYFESNPTTFSIVIMIFRMAYAHQLRSMPMTLLFGKADHA